MRASTRWRRLVQARLGEMEELRPGQGAIGPAFWSSRARRFAAGMDGTAERDPFLARVRRATDRRCVVLDVGAGSGRFALALAPRAAEVVAVDSSPAMLDQLSKRARRLRVTNVRRVVGRWEDVDVAPADVAICSYVLPLVAEVSPFLRKLDAHARRRAFLYMGAASLDLLLDPMWRHFHGGPRRPGPTYLDAVDVLGELGITTDVEVVEVPVRARFKSLGAAVKSYRDQLFLPDGPGVGRELRSLLSSWLVAGADGFRPPVRTMPSAIVSWGPGRH